MNVLLFNNMEVLVLVSGNPNISGIPYLWGQFFGYDISTSLNKIWNILLDLLLNYKLKGGILFLGSCLWTTKKDDRIRIFMY